MDYILILSPRKTEKRRPGLEAHEPISKSREKEAMIGRFIVCGHKKS